MRMWAAVGEVLPIAVAVALSSVPIMAIILILLGPDSRRSSIAFLVGWILGLAVVVIVFTALAYVLPTAPPRRSQTLIGTLQIILGAAAVVGAVIVWRRGIGRPSAELPGWLDKVGELRWWQAFGLALLLNIRPKAILLSIAAGLAIRAADLSTSENVIVVAVYTVIGAAAVAFPVVASLIRPDTTRSDLERARTRISDSSRIVGVLTLLLIGVVIIGNGLSRL
jgi:hypothetical protein